MTKLTRFTFVALLAVGVLTFAPQAYAQTTTNTTTTTEAVDNTETNITLTSASGSVAGDYLYMDGEAMLVTAVDTTNNDVDVQRGMLGTVARAHISGQLVYLEQPGAFVAQSIRRFGACTAADYDYLPEINPVLAEKYACKDGQWVAYQLGELINVTHAYGATVADHVDAVVWIADDTYRVTEIQAIWGTAESTGDMNIDPERLQGTEACASGDDLATAAINATGTADTVNTFTLTDGTTMNLAEGDRLCIDLTATPNEVTGLTVTFSLIRN